MPASPYSPESGNVFLFEAPPVDSLLCGNFTIQTFPELCRPCRGKPIVWRPVWWEMKTVIWPDQEWDGSSIQDRGQLRWRLDFRFQIQNVGNGSMEQPSQLIIIEDDIVVMLQDFELDGGETTEFSFPASGASFHVQALQSLGHPGFSLSQPDHRRAAGVILAWALFHNM